MAAFNVQKITTGSKTSVSFSDPKSMVFTNTHATASVTIDLYLTSQVSADITATLVYAVGSPSTSENSTPVAVDNGSGAASAANNDGFLNERVYKSDGTFFGICTTVNTNILLTFAGGLANNITDNDILHTGTRYHILNNVIIPNGSSLKLTSDELVFDNVSYGMYINSSSGTGDIDIITRF